MELTAQTAATTHAGSRIVTLIGDAVALLERYAAPLLDLALRLYVASVFFKSGLTKLQSWESTLSLFENEYAVPLLPSDVAAYLGTFTELSVPLLLAAGIGGRAAAAVLFVFNIVAAISYPDLSPAGLVQHQMWGAMLLVTLVHGPGKLSIDHFIRRRFAR